MVNFMHAIGMQVLKWGFAESGIFARTFLNEISAVKREESGPTFAE